MAASPPPCAADTLALLSQGAEARVYSGTFLGRACVVKHRFPKVYRHPVLDARLTRERLMSEARALARARAAGVDVPLLYSVDAPGGVLILERIAGPTVKAWLRGRSSAAASGPFAAAVAAHMGAAIARLHAAGMSHGDLTTSNLILRGLPEKWLHANDELYHGLRGPAENVTVLASALSDKTNEQEPMLRAIPFGQGRVFHTALGHAVDAVNGLGFQVTFARGLEWSATGHVTLPSPQSGEFSLTNVSVRDVSAR